MKYLRLRLAKLKNNINSGNQGFVRSLFLSVPRYCDWFLGVEEASKVIRGHEQASSLFGADVGLHHSYVLETH